MGYSWEDKPPRYTPAELEELSERNKREYYAHLSVHRADNAARYAVYGAIAVAGALAAIVSIIMVLVWLSP